MPFHTELLEKAGDVLSRAGRFPQDIEKAARVAKHNKNLRAVAIHRFFAENKLGRFKSDEGFDDVVIAGDLARSKSFADRRKKFKSHFPEGELGWTMVGGKFIEFFKKLPQEPWREMTVRGMPPWVVDLVGNIEPTLGLLAGGRRVSRAAAGFTAGSILESEIERQRGFESRSRVETVFDAAKTGAVVFTGGIAISGVTRGLIAIKEGPGQAITELLSAIRPPVRVSPLSRPIIEASERAGLEPLALGQTARHPTVTSMFEQASGTSPVAEELIHAQVLSVISKMQGVIRRTRSGTMPPDLTDAKLDALLIARTAWLQRKIDTPLLSRRQGGLAEQEGVRTYITASYRKLDRLHQDAASQMTGNAIYDLGPAKALARDATRLNREIGDSTFGEFLDWVKVLRGKTSVSREVQAPFESMSALRTGFFDMSINHPNAAVRQLSGDLYTSIKTAMENPVGGSFKFGWKTKMSEAFAFRADFEALLRKQAVSKAMSVLPPEVLTKKYIVPGFSEDVMTMKGILTSPQWKQIKGMATQEFFNNPAAFKALQAKDEATLLALYNKTELKGMSLIMKAQERWESGALAKIARQQLPAQERNITLLREGSMEDVATIVEATGGRNGAAAIDMRAHAYEYILERSSAISPRGTVTLNFNRYDAAVKQVRKWRGVNAVMGNADWAALDTYTRYLAITARKMDMGGALQRAAIVAQLRTAAAPMAIWKIGKNAIAARILAQPASRTVLLEGKDRTLESLLIRFGQASIVAADLYLQDHGVKPE
jgi:hypothetical protein